MFLYEEGEVKPDRVVPLHAAECTDLQNPRKDRPDAFRIIGDGKEVVVSGSKESAFGTAEWRSLLSALAKGEIVKMTKLFGASLEGILSEQNEDMGSCRAPAILFCCFDQLQRLNFTKTEGIFRIPGDTVEVAAMKRLFERGSLRLVGEDHSDIDLGSVSNWSSLLKAWLRELAEPLFPSGKTYDEAMAIAVEYDAINRPTSDSSVAETMDLTRAEKISDLVQRVVAVVEALPNTNRVILQHVCANLRKIDPIATKMTVQNLAICWAPCLFRCVDIATALANAKKEICITELLIAELLLPADELQEDWAKFHALPEIRSESN